MNTNNEFIEELVLIPVDTIQPNRFQPRKEFSQKELEELADSIDTHGLLQPITVRRIDDGDKNIEFEIVAGERRWRAHRLLGKARIKAIVREDIDDEKSMEAALIENLQREDLNPIEEAESIVKLQKARGFTQEQLAQRLGKSRAYISQVVRLVRLPEDVQDKLRAGELDRWHGTILAAAPKEMQSELANKAVKGKWNTEVLRKRVAAIKEEEAEGDAPIKAPKKAKVLSNNVLMIEAPSGKALRELLEELQKDDDLKLWKGRKEITAALAEEVKDEEAAKESEAA